ncbi:hypothetical protein B0H34DRAFT_672810 [Crassisporium funariophilum]|nr:hypothetical protein B0H34DRAFT_672810 [Crassisporium funariophilum]
MDVALSMLTGLGIRFFLTTATGAGPTGLLSTALVGIWEGVVVHQLSGRSSSKNIDHFLAYGLRVAVDLLISKNLPRIVLVLLWTALGAVASEAITPHSSLQSARKRERERERERRHRHSRSVSAPTLNNSTPVLPARIRAYRRPTDTQPQFSSPILPLQPPQLSSTPLISSIPPGTPPSFFLHENTELYSPSPKPVHIQTLHVVESSTRDALPVRPRSGLASILDRTPESSGSPLPVPMHLPTPPESAQSAVPSDGPADVNANDGYPDDTKIPSFRPLSTIPELSSPEGNTPPETTDLHDNGPETRSEAPNSAPLPVPNAGMRPVSSSKSKGKQRASDAKELDSESFFATPFSPAMASANPIPVPVPFRSRQQEPLWDIRTPTRSHLEFDHNHGEDGDNEHDNHDSPNDNASESDELRTPGAREKLNMETDNEYDNDPLLTPVRLRTGGQNQEEREDEGELSPLGLNMHSGLGSDDYLLVSDPEEPITGGPGAIFLYPPDPVEAHGGGDEPPMPGSLSLSQNLLLQPPLPSSGPFLLRSISPPPETPVPPSPSTVISDTSAVSIFSTLVPSKLYTKADLLRQQARQEEQTRAQLEADRKTAETQGRMAEALLLKVRVRELDDRVYKLHEKAARRYYAARNPLERCSKIDLHGLRPREAFVRTERALVKAIKEGRKTVRIIVGKGNHSVNGQAVLKQTIHRDIVRNGFQCEVDARNPGQLIVTLPPPLPPR